MPIRYGATFDEEGFRSSCIAATAVAGSAFQRSVTALSPGSAAVTIHDLDPSAP